VSGGTQVGYGDGSFSGNLTTHALMWTGTSASVVDLNPPTFVTSHAYAVAGTTQVGSGQSSTNPDQVHAIAWNGTAASYVDLHSYVTALNPNFRGSVAFGVSEGGVVVGNAIDANDVSYAVMWTPVPLPEPASCTLVAWGVAIVLIRRKSNHRQ
jgi:hypothetical protein